MSKSFPAGISALLGLALTVILAAPMNMANAVTCSASVAASVSGTSACELGNTNNDFLNPLQVNIDSKFGFSDWAFDAKDDDLDGVNDGANTLGLSLIGNTLSGTWSIASNAFDLFSDIMLVFKGGAGNTEPGSYVAYLLSDISGDYQSPFTNPNNGNPKNISHVSLYVRDSLTPIPLPAGVWLFLTALGGFGFLGWRKNRKAAPVA